MKNLFLFCFSVCVFASVASSASVTSNLPGVRIKKDLESIRSYGNAWNTGDVNSIVNHFTDDAEFVYTDSLVSPNIVSGKQVGGIRCKADLRAYAVSVFKVYPKQNWSESVEVFPGRKPGSYAIYYHFSLYRNVTDQIPAFTGTGMENMQLDENHKLVREEIHLSFSQGQVDSSLSLGIPNFYRNRQLE